MHRLDSTKVLFMPSATPFRRGVYVGCQPMSISEFLSTAVIFSLQYSLPLSNWRAWIRRPARFSANLLNSTNFSHTWFGSHEINLAPPTAFVNQSEEETNSALRILCSHRTTDIGVDKLRRCFRETMAYPVRTACQLVDFAARRVSHTKSFTISKLKPSALF